jgi:hypothetical protein
MAKVTDGVALAAASSPFWLPTLAQVSQVAGLLLPIFGCAWLLIQVVLRIRQEIKRPPRSGEGD